MPGHRGVPPRLLRAYLRTAYRAGDVTVHIGRRSVAMDALLARYGAICAVFITAWNPYSRPMPAGWNRRMQAHLRQRLRRRVVLPAHGGLGRWQEDHLLVLAPLPVVARWGLVFRQNALVSVRRGAEARLHLLGRPGTRACLPRPEVSRV